MNSFELVSFTTDGFNHIEGALINVTNEGRATILCFDDMSFYIGNEYQLDYLNETVANEAITLNS